MKVLKRATKYSPFANVATEDDKSHKIRKKKYY